MFSVINYILHSFLMNDLYNRCVVICGVRSKATPAGCIGISTGLFFKDYASS